MASWWEFFDKNEDFVLKVRYYENSREFTLEELYQAFKARLAEESTEAPDDDAEQGEG